MRLTHAAIALTAFCTWFGEVAGQTAFPTPAICNAEPTRPVIHRTTEAPTGFPTDSPTKSPTMFPIKSPTMSPSKSPTMSPIKSPTMSPSKSPTMSPSKSPTMFPIKSPTMSPSKSPTMSPSKSPTMSPIKAPTMSPSKSPTMSPTMNPTKLPTMFPSKSPTMSPTKIPTKSPTRRPTMSPTKRPTLAPVNIIPLMQTRSPSKSPTKRPSNSPTMSPSKAPTKLPSKTPTKRPTKSPSKSPTKSPSKRPSKSPTKSPTMSPTKRPTTRPTSAPTCTYKPLAICIALDQSGSICTPPGVPAHTCTSCPLCQNYRDQLNFASNFTKLLAQAEKANVQHRFSAVEFSTVSTVVLNLTNNEAAARSTIDALTYQGGMTNTGDALRDCYKLLINQDATPFIILVTDGVPTAGGPGPLGRQYASHKNYSSAMAKMVKDSGIGLVPVYVNTGNSETDSGYLKTLSSDGDYLDVKSFDDLKNSVTSLAAMVNCRNTSWVPKSLSPTKRPTKLPTKSPSKSPTMFPTKSPTMRPTKRPTNTPVKSPTSRPSMSPTKRPTKTPSKSPTKSPTKRPTSAPTCASKPLAVCIALDQSGSICSGNNINECLNCPKCKNFQDELDFASAFIKRLVSFENGIIQHQFSAVKFSTESVIHVGLTTDETYVAQKVTNMTYEGGMTNTGDAIYDCYNSLKSQGASPHIVLVTDGTPTIGGNSVTSHRDHATAAATLVRNSGMGLIPVIVNTGTSHVDAAFLQTLGTDQNKFINVTNFNQLNSTVMKLVDMVKCGNTSWIPIPKSPTKRPTKSPTKSPIKSPTKSPTKRPTKSPTKSPIKSPTKSPTKTPTQQFVCPTNPNWVKFDELSTFESTSNNWMDPDTSTINSRLVEDPSCPTGKFCWRLSGGTTPDDWDRRVYKYLYFSGNLNFTISFSYNATGAGGTLFVEEYCAIGASSDWTTLQTFRMSSTDLVPNVVGCKQVNFTYPRGCTKGKILCTWNAPTTNDQIFLDDIQIFTR